MFARSFEEPHEKGAAVSDDDSVRDEQQPTPGDGHDFPPAIEAPMQDYVRQLDRILSAEVQFRGTMTSEYIRQKGKVTRRSMKRVDAAFGVLAEEVIALQQSNHALHEACDALGIAWDALCGAHEEDVAWADDYYAGYLVATSDEDVHAALEAGGS